MQKDTIGLLLAALQREELPFRENEPLASHTTFRIGGPASVFCMPQDMTRLARTLELCRQFGVRYYLLGNGSNTLFADAGFAGAVISLTGLAGRVTFAPQPDGRTMVHAGAGMQLSALCTAVQRAGLAGLEFAFGIPGTVGGAVYMDAGAYGGEMRDVLAAASYLDEAGRLNTLPVDALALGYRTSIFERRAWCIVEATFSLAAGDPDAIAARMQTYMARRREKQPLELPSAGSTFKRPAGCFAGQLIDQCGLRGYRVGGAAVSTKHCGFVVNLGGATCADVVRLTDEVSRIVEEKTGHTLEREIRVVE